MSWTIRLTDEAEADLQQSYDYYERQGAGLGSRYLANVRAALDVLEEMPTIFGEIVPDVRFRLVDRFQHVVYYVVIEEIVHVIGVIHAKRDPAIWKERWKNFREQIE